MLRTNLFLFIKHLLATAEVILRLGSKKPNRSGIKGSVNKLRSAKETSNMSGKLWILPLLLD